MRNYIGLIHKDADSHFGVSFPDFPGVITAGTTLDDARAMAEEALALHIEGLVEDGEAIPVFRVRLLAESVRQRHQRSDVLA